MTSALSLTLPFYIHPGIFMILAGVILFPLPTKARRIGHVIVALLGWILTAIIPIGTSQNLDVLGEYTMHLLHVDEYNYIFLLIFSTVGVIGAIFSFGHTKKLEGFASTAYVGCALSVTLAEDWLTFFIFWEVMAMIAMLLIWDNHTMSSTKAGFRYFFTHMVGGSLLLFGIADQMIEGSYLIVQMNGGEHNLSFWLIFLGMAISAGIVPFHFWIPDAYPESTITGGAYLNALTTKVAAFSLMSAFLGFKVMIVLGIIMIFYGSIYALMESDFRRILSYHIISQVGFIIADIGIGQAIGTNAAAAMTFAHILYKSTLFMCAGAIIYVTGKRNITQMGGLAKRLPFVTIIYFIAALSISGVPPFAGFTCKSWSIVAAEESGLMWVAILMILGSVTTAMSVLFKTGYYVFFGEQRGDYEIKKVPCNMKIAMGIGGGLCVFVGVTPQIFYQILPYHIEYHPYSVGHVFEYVEMIAGCLLIFLLFLKKLKPHYGIHLDIDYFLRVPGEHSLYKGSALVVKIYGFFANAAKSLYHRIQIISHNPYGKRPGNNQPEEEKGTLRYMEDAHRMEIGVGMLAIMISLIIIGIILIGLMVVRGS